VSKISRLIQITVICSTLAFGKAWAVMIEVDEPPALVSMQDDHSPFISRSGPAAKSSTFWRPAVSLVLPGFDQFLNHQFSYGAAYSGLFLVSSLWAQDRNRNVEDYEKDISFRRLSNDQRDNVRIHDEKYKQRTLANQFILFSGGLSAYHSFRTSIRSHQPYGAYSFLSKEETPGEILMAPFRFEFLKRTSTLAPLALITTLAVLDANTKHQNYKRDPITSSDVFYTAAISFNAGTYEEAIFRGWLMPMMREGTGSEFWSNFLQASLFAAAHLNQISMPYTQFGLGFYLGWLTQHSDWTLAESIFIHTWWDVAALTIQYSNRKKSYHGQIPVIWLPGLRLAF